MRPCAPSSTCFVPWPTASPLRSAPRSLASPRCMRADPNPTPNPNPNPNPNPDPNPNPNPTLSEVHARWRHFVASWRALAPGAPLHFCSSDIAQCYDTIDQVTHHGATPTPNG